MYLLCYCLCYFAGNYTLNAQKIDSLKPKKEMRGTLWIGTNISMPIFALVFKGGYGGEINSLYFVNNHLALSLGGGVINYKGTGATTSENYNSLGFHFRGGIALDAGGFILDNSRLINEDVILDVLFGFNFVWAKVNETGFWKPDTGSSVSNTDYWGGGYSFDEVRNVSGVEMSLSFVTKINHHHLINFKPYFTIFTYDNKSYFPLSSASGFGYMPFTSTLSNISATFGMQVWYYLRVK